jgi:hypothetical protein
VARTNGSGYGVTPFEPVTEAIVLDVPYCGISDKVPVSAAALTLNLSPLTVWRSLAWGRRSEDEHE